jgi:hypothetical protein
MTIALLAAIAFALPLIRQDDPAAMIEKLVEAA